MPAGHSDEAQFRALDQYALVAGRDVRARWPEPNGKSDILPSPETCDRGNRCDQSL